MVQYEEVCFVICGRYHLDLCKNVFGEAIYPDVDATNIYYGGTDIAGMITAIFTAWGSLFCFFIYMNFEFLFYLFSSFFGGGDFIAILLDVLLLKLRYVYIGEDPHPSSWTR